MNKMLLWFIVSALLPSLSLAFDDQYDNSFSDDGRYMAHVFFDDFLSQVAIVDRLTNETTLVSADRFGDGGNESSMDAMISGNGRFVVYSSLATNIIEESADRFRNILLYDRLHDNTQWLGRGQAPRITPDGRFIAFLNRDDSSEFDTNSSRDVYTYDLQTGELELISIVNGQSVSSNSPEFVANRGADLIWPSISEDGRFVTFETRAALVSDDNNNEPDIYIRDRLLKTTSRVSVSTENKEGNNGSFQSRVSRNGQFVVFTSDADNLVSNDVNGVRDVFIRNLALDTTTSLSDFESGREGLESIFRHTTSADDKFVAYPASGIRRGDRFELWFVHDLERGTYRNYFRDVAEEISRSGFIRYAGLGWVPLNIDPVCPDHDGDNLGPDNCVPFSTDGSSFNARVYEGLECVDEDGDGFGWQQPDNTPGRSCIVDSDNAIQPMADTNCIDSDGDGFGWNGTETCFPDGGDPQPVADQPLICIDSDGDGFGWNGIETCFPDSGEPQLAADQSPTCIDSDGDGFGWNGIETCLPHESSPARFEQPLVCIDFDGDGYGWTGLQSCRIDDQGNIVLL